MNNSSTIRSPLYTLIDQLSALPIDQETLISITCEQALWGTLVSGQEKGRELATTSLEFVLHLQFPCGSSLTELSDFCESVQSRNECECTQTLARYMPRIKPSPPISINFPLTFSLQIFQFQRRSCKHSFLLSLHCHSTPGSLLAGYNQCSSQNCEKVLK